LVFPVDSFLLAFPPMNVQLHYSKNEASLLPKSIFLYSDY
jgi:hypothetical protein